MRRHQGTKTRIRLALDRVQKSIRISAEEGGKWARGLSSEGYAGGYAQALMDVELVLNNVKPNARSEYWQDWINNQ